MITQRKPTSAGEILQAEFLEPLNLKIGDLAEILGVHRNTASSIVNNSCRISPEMACKLAKAFDTTPLFWLNLQTAVDMWELNHNTRFQQSLAEVKEVNQWQGSPAFA